MWKGFAAHDFNDDGLDDLVVTTDGDDLILIIYSDGSTQTLLEAGDKLKMQCATADKIKMTASLLQILRTQPTDQI